MIYCVKYSVKGQLTKKFMKASNQDEALMRVMNSTSHDGVHISPDLGSIAIRPVHKRLTVKVIKSENSTGRS